jgi:aryl-alcohol dehydrogenase-like predicted oxidoreductase
MRHNRLGFNDLRVSELCLETMTWGEQDTEAEAHQQLGYALSRGIDFIDAAEMYPVPPRAETQGRTEAILGPWLKRQQRDKLIVATKIAAPRPGLAANGLSPPPSSMPPASRNSARTSRRPILPLDAKVRTVIDEIHHRFPSPTA